MATAGKILITGAAGFVGTALCRHLYRQGYKLRVLIRRGGTPLPEDLAKVLDDIVVIDDLAGALPWPTLLEGVDSVIHLAARAHNSVSEGCSSDLFFHENLDATVALGEAALKAKIRRFIFLSTIKVNGEGGWGAGSHPYKASDKPIPQGSYAVSKWRAEQELQFLFANSKESELNIIRPFLVYGPGSKGNLGLLQKWLKLGLPLPVSRQENQRSMIYIGNLVALIEYCLFRTGVCDRILLAADPEVWSLASFVEFMAQGLGRSVRILKVPDMGLRWAAKIIRKESFFGKMFGSLSAECEEISETGWRSPMSEKDISEDLTNL